MEKYFTTIEAFACRHGKCFNSKSALDWLRRLERGPMWDEAGIYTHDSVKFSFLKDQFQSRWGIVEEFHYVYETWKSLIEKHGYNPYAFTRESVTYKENKTTVVKEKELAKIKGILNGL